MTQWYTYHSVLLAGHSVTLSVHQCSSYCKWNDLTHVTHYCQRSCALTSTDVKV